MSKTLIAACVAAPLALSLGACSKSKQATETAQRVEQTRGATTLAGEMTATVENVDREKRTLTLRGPDGDRFTVAVSEEAPIERIEPNDTLNVAYQGVLSFELKEPGSPPKQDATMSSKELPNGVQYARQVEATVDILAVAPEGTSVTFRDPNGQMRTVEVMNPDNRPKVAKLRPGDSVDIAFTEQLDVNLQK